MLSTPKIGLFALLLACVAGCTDARRNPSPVDEARGTDTPTRLIDMDGVQHRLPQGEAAFLAALIAEEPDVDTSDHLALDPPYRVIINDVDFALETDELILMHPDGRKHWSSPGVRDRLLRSVGITE